MEEKNSKILCKRCIAKTRRSCDCCKHKLRCTLVLLGLVAKRLVFLAKRKVLLMFAKRPRKCAKPSWENRKIYLLYGIVGCMLFCCILSFFLPIFGMKQVAAEAPTADSTSQETQAEESHVLASFTDDSYVTEAVLVGAGVPKDVVEVTTDVVEEPIIVQKEVVIEPEPATQTETLDDIIGEYDVPLDYDVDLAFQGMDILVNEHGFSVAGAAGVMGNFYAECRYDSSLISGSYKGLAQWDSVNRWPMIAEWMNANGYDLTSFVGQMNAIFYSEDANEFTSGNPYRTFDKMREATDPRSAALTWLYEYERAPGQAEATRQDIAELTYELYVRTH